MPPAKSDTHVTPQRVWDLIEESWGLEKYDMFDPCPVNGTNGLTVQWKSINYVNPPYTLLTEFVHKAIDESKAYDSRTVLLLPCKTDQQWFHDLMKQNVEVVWIKGRLKFVGNKWSATQPHFLALIKEYLWGKNAW
tara:strand:- start:458 stop:865 length:408 start_codon:yes stop_codon:yes gene_type:complete